MLDKSHKTIVANDMDCRCIKKSKKYGFILRVIVYVVSFMTYHATNLVTLTTNDVLPHGNIF